MIDPCKLILNRVIYEDDGKKCSYIGQTDKIKKEKNGIGKEEFSNRCTYIGHWLNGLFCGHGKLYTRAAEESNAGEYSLCYTGEFEDGRMHGFGILVRYYTPNDTLRKEPKRIVDKFSGQFTKGKPGAIGRRIIYLSKYNVKILQGKFINNQLTYQCRPERIEMAVQRAEESQRIAEAVLSEYIRTAPVMR